MGIEFIFRAVRRIGDASRASRFRGSIREDFMLLKSGGL
jgi:hypothetical protein